MLNDEVSSSFILPFAAFSNTFDMTKALTAPGERLGVSPPSNSGRTRRADALPLANLRDVVTPPPRIRLA